MAPKKKAVKKASSVGLRLKKATDAFMQAWAEWHDTTDQLPSDDVLNAAVGIFEARGMTFEEDANGKYQVVREVVKRRGK